MASRRDGTSLLDALRPLRKRIAELVDEQRDMWRAGDGLGHGLFVGEGDVDAALSAVDRLLDADDGSLPVGALERVASIFGLDDTEVAVIVAGAAPAIDRRFGLLYAYLNDSLSRQHLTVELAMRVAGVAPWDARARFALGDDGTLAGCGLVELGDRAELLNRSVTTSTRLVEHLLGMDVAPAEVTRVVAPLVPGSDVAGSVLAALTSGAPTVYLRSSHEASITAAVASAANKAELNVVHLDLRPLASPSDARLAAWLPIALREAALQGAIPLLGPIPEGLEPGSFDALAYARVPVVLYGATEWDVALSTSTPVTIDVAPISEREQAEVWQSAFASYGIDVDGDGIGAYRLSGAAVVRSVTRAVTAAGINDTPVDAALVTEQVRREQAPVMERLAMRVVPTVTTDALVLPPRTSRAIAEMVERIRNRDRVREELGVRNRGTKGRGFSALFAGSSGTGKTLAAEGIGGELGVDLYVINLSSVVSKYIGETEKNLERIFDTANDMSGVLFFDEADALFGKRSEVSDARDRYANIEVAYLLQRLEQFDGVSILATNLQPNIDAAFTRRLDTIVSFPEPGPEERLRLWEVHLPPTLPRSKRTLDLSFAAERFRLSGGSIASACRTAAHEVARTGRPLDSGMIARAVAVELHKMGRLVDTSDFGQWASELLSDDKTAADVAGD